MIRGKRGSLFAMLVAILVIIFMLVTYYQMTSKTFIEGYKGNYRSIGEYQAALMETMHEAENALLYVDQAAKYSLRASMQQYSEAGGEYRPVYDGSDTGAALGESACGTFVYNKWSTQEKFCEPPSPEATFGDFVTPNMNRYLAQMAPYDFPMNNYKYEVKQQGGEYVITGKAQEPLKMSVTHSDSAAEFQGEFALPVADPWVTSCFGHRKIDGQPDYHDGLDFGRVGDLTGVYAIETGTVYSVCDGQMCSVLNNEDCSEVCGGYGNNILIQHSENLFSRYSHMAPDSITVREGEKVERGDTIGSIGNTGRSSGAHLDLKIYTSEDFDADQEGSSKNPLCFYEDEQLAGLKRADTATSCLPEHGVAFKEEDIQGQCEKINFNKINGGIGKESDYEERRIGEYEVMPHFNVRTDLVLPGASDRRQEVIEWARNTWEECKNSPQSCLKEEARKHNEVEDHNYTIKTNAAACEEYKFYYEIIERFETCFDNKQQGCGCELSLAQIDDVRDYNITISEHRITMHEPVERSYEFDRDVSYFSQVAGDASNIKDLSIVKSGNDISIYTPQGKENYPFLRMFKPTRNKTVIVRQIKPEPICNEHRDTFLVCAESEEKYKFQEGDQITERKERLKFALELEDVEPVKDESEVDMKKVEKSKDELAQKAEEMAAKQALTIALGPLGPIVSSLLPSFQKAAFQITIDKSQFEDISGFAVHCSVGSPVGEVSVGTSETKFVDTRNEYLESLEADVEDAKNNLDAKLERVEKVNEINEEKACEYVKLIGEGGAVQYVNKLRTMDLGDKTSFIMSQCGSDPIKQLAQGLSPQYCVTLTPIDSQGNKGEPIEVCERFTSLEDRVFQALGLKNAKETFVKVSTDAKEVASAIRNGDYSKAVDIVKGTDIGEGLKNSDVGRALSDNVVTNTIQDAEEELNPEEFKQAVRQTVGNAQEARDVLQQFIQDPDIPEEYKQQARERLTEIVDYEDKREFVEEIPGEVSRFREETQERVTEFVQAKVAGWSVDKKVDVLKKADQKSQEIGDYIERLKERNYDHNEEARQSGELEPLEFHPEIDLTEPQVHDTFDKILAGELGPGPRKIIMEEVMPELEPRKVEKLYEEVHNLELDRRVREIVNEEMRQLSDEKRQELLDRVFEEVPKDVAGEIAEGLSRAKQGELYNHLYDRYGDTITSAVDASINGIFNPPQCAPNPFDNIDLPE